MFYECFIFTLGERAEFLPNLKHMGEGRDKKNMEHLAYEFWGHSVLISGMHLDKNNDERTRILCLVAK